MSDRIWYAGSILIIIAILFKDWFAPAAVAPPVLLDETGKQVGAGVIGWVDVSCRYHRSADTPMARVAEKQFLAGGSPAIYKEIDHLEGRDMPKGISE